MISRSVVASAEEIKGVFERDGFVILRGHLSADEISEMRERTDRYLTERTEHA